MTNDELIALVNADEDSEDLGFLASVASRLDQRHIDVLIGLAIALRDKGDKANEADRIEDSLALNDAQEAINETRIRLG